MLGGAGEGGAGEGGVSEGGAGEGGTPASTGGEAGAAVGGVGAAGGDSVGEPIDGCVVNSTYGNIGDLAGGSARTVPDAVLFRLPIQPGSPADQVGINLFDGYGVFTDGITPGTFELTGAELNYATCGLCVFLEEDVGTSNYRGLYMATGGTVTLTSVEGNITGTLDGITLEHVLLDDGAVSSPAPDGCTTKIKYLGFDAPVIMP